MAFQLGTEKSFDGIDYVFIRFGLSIIISQPLFAHKNTDRMESLHRLQEAEYCHKERSLSFVIH